MKQRVLIVGDGYASRSVASALQRLEARNVALECSTGTVGTDMEGDPSASSIPGVDAWNASVDQLKADKRRRRTMRKLKGWITP